MRLDQGEKRVLSSQLGEQYEDKAALITGFRQPKREWLEAIASGRMRYHAAEEKSVTIDVTGDTAELVGGARSRPPSTAVAEPGTSSSRRSTSARMGRGSPRRPSPRPFDAVPDTAIQHVAVAKALDGEALDWLEKVGDAEHRAGARRLSGDEGR